VDGFSAASGWVVASSSMETTALPRHEKHFLIDIISLLVVRTFRAVIV
jgi:hypothetical protein